MRCFLFLFLFVGSLCCVPAETSAFSVLAEKEQTGVIATVNGRPITLHRLEALHDIDGDADLLAHTPSLELLQQQYGDALAALIVHELVAQELEKRNLSVSDETVRAEEAAIRADYPPGEFEVMLQENAIDLNAWRERVRARLAVQLFQKSVLRPRFSVSPEEIQAEYAANAALVKQPEKVEIIWVEDTDKKRLEDVRNAWLTDKTILSGITPEGSRANVLRISPTRLPETLRRDLAAIKPQQATPIRQEGGVHFFAGLLARFPARTLDVVEAYPLMEALVVERKLPAAYAEWVTEALSRADVRVVSRLQPDALSGQTRRNAADRGEPMPRQSDKPLAPEGSDKEGQN